MINATNMTLVETHGVLGKIYRRPDGSHVTDRGEPVTPCRYCDAFTRHCATQQCDGCWEVTSRLETFLKAPGGREFVAKTLQQEQPGRPDLTAIASQMDDTGERLGRITRKRDSYGSIPPAAKAFRQSVEKLDPKRTK